MPRTARVIIPGVAHHVVQRGNNRRTVFDNHKDFLNYCFWINQYSAQFKVLILAYCLMLNHVHLVAVPEIATSLSDLFRLVHMRYAQYINRRRQTTGHLWQGRFYSCVLDEPHLYNAIRYVEQNPVRAGIVTHPWDYEWSSAKWHVNRPGERYIGIKKCLPADGAQWEDFLAQREESFDDEIRKKTFRGRALASEEFIDFWESKLGRQLSKKKRGLNRT